MLRFSWTSQNHHAHRQHTLAAHRGNTLKTYQLVDETSAVAVLLQSLTPQLAAGASSLIFPCLTSPHCAHRLHPLPCASSDLSSEAMRALHPTFGTQQHCYYSLETGVKGTHLCPSLPPAVQSILICRVCVASLQKAVLISCCQTLLSLHHDSLSWFRLG